MHNTFKLAKIDLIDINFKTQVINRKHDHLPISGKKIMNLRTGEVKPRTKNDHFSFECPVNYIPESEWTAADKHDLKQFIDHIFIEDPEYIKYIQIKFGSYLCGENSRIADFNVGVGKNGKSYIVKALAIILGGFYGYIDKDVIASNPEKFKRKGGAGNHTSHLIPIDGKRLVVTQELEENDTINSEFFKKIVSGDPIEAVRECYGRKTYQIFPMCKLVVNTNKKPQFDSNDTAEVERIIFNPFKARFLNEIGIKSEKLDGKYDESKYKYYPSDDTLAKKYTIVGRNIDVLFSWMVQGCIEFYAKYNDGCGIPVPDIVRNYTEEILFQNDIVLKWIKEQCESVSVGLWNSMTLKEKRKYKTPRAEAFKSFVNWAKDFGLKFTKSKFNESMSARFELKKTNEKVMYERLRIKESIADDNEEENDDDDENDDDENDDVSNDSNDDYNDYEDSSTGCRYNYSKLKKLF